ncbi:MAG: HipA domain-containing protein [Bifidobacteriaceae bacterium]|jgi:serine/threonine-protein kinase HipA|nr:HipA domain-containing protein [Bifidobacteriaceae bacterium]
MTARLDLWLAGRLAGVVTQGDDGRCSFDYDKAYRREAAAESLPALSVSIPLTQAHHGPAVVDPWLDNLLPDDDEVRRRWAGRFGEHVGSAFALLRHTGADCPGAVQLLPEGQTPDEQGSYAPISGKEIAAHIAALRADPAEWAFPEDGGRWSLAGQQSKFALAREPDGTWLLPSGRAPSTHILKLGVAGLAQSDVAEFVTMRAARTLGLPVPAVELVRFGDALALSVARFDRVRDAAGRVVRLHQEDMCQALGLWRSLKYQDDGGPSLGDIAHLIGGAVDPRDRAGSLASFAAAACFNWVFAGTDAHAKNFALVHAGPRIVSAPFFDLVSAVLVWNEATVAFKGKLAMKMGGRYRLGDIGPHQLERAAEDLLVTPDYMIETARRYVGAMPDAVRDATREAAAADALTAAQAARFIDAAAARAKRLAAMSATR